MASRGTRNPMKRTGVCRVIARAVASHIAGKASPPRNTSWGAFGPSGFCLVPVRLPESGRQCRWPQSRVDRLPSSDILRTQRAARSCGNAAGF
jgi:hypothetical protein